MTTATKSDRVTVTCPDCGLDRSVHRKTYNGIRAGHGSARCHPCGNAARKAPKVAPEPQRDDTWRNKAACLTVDPELFFPIGEPGSNAYERASQDARAVCSVCSVMVECLEDSLATGDRWAIRGGLDPDERGQQFGTRRRRKGVAA